MHMFFVLLAAAWFTLSMPDYAYSDPVTTAIFGAVFAATIPGQLISIGLGLAFSYGVGLIQKARAKRKAKDQTKGTSFELQVGDDQPMSFTVGKFAAGGRRKYTGIMGENGRYFVDVIELENLPNQGLPEIWVNDEKVEIDWEHPNESGFGYPVPAFISGSQNTQHLWVIYHDGTQTVADNHLLTYFATDPDRPFTSDMIGRGCPYLVVTARFNPEIFPSVPSILVEPPVRKFYDLRKDSTNGGSGTHRWDTPSTWESTQNPIIIIYNIIRGVYYGSEWVYGGQNLAAFRLPASNWIAAANECDVDIALEGGGTEKQFRAGYEIFCDVEPLTVIEELLQACNGRLAEVGGIFKVLVGAPGAAVFSFTDEDVIITDGQSFNPFPPFSDTHNGIEATYPEPAEKWATKDAPPRYSEEYMEADLGQELVVGIEFEAVPFKTQVQRLTKVMLLEERRFRSHEFHLPPSAWRLEPNDVVSWTSERNGYVNKKFLVIRVVGRRTFNQLVSLKEIDPADYDWSPTEELPTVVGPVKPIIPQPQPMTGWSAVGWTIMDSGSRSRRPAIKVTATANLDDVKNVRVQVRLKSSGAVVFDSDATPYDDPYEWVISGQWTLPAMLYQARGILLPFTSRKTLWSSWLDVTTPDVQLISDDILDGAIISAKINDSAITASKIANEAVTNLKLADAAVSTAKIAVDAVTRDVIKNGEIITSKIADGAMTITKFATGLKPVEGPFTTAPTTGNFEGRVATIGVAPNLKLMRYTGGSWTAAVDTVDLVGTVGTSQIADNAITNLKLGPLAVDAAKLAANAVTVTKIADDAISTPKLQANAVVADKIGANAVLARNIVVADFENLIPDGTFDQALSGLTDIWELSPNKFDGLTNTAEGTAPAFWLSPTVATGKYAVVMDNKTTGGSGTQLYMQTKDFSPCTTGDTLAWEIANRGSGGVSAAGFYLRVMWFTSTGAVNSPVASNDVVGNASIPAAYQTFNGQVVVPDGATQYKLRVIFHITATTRYNFIDRVIVRKAKGAQLIVDGTIITDMLSANAITSDKINANAVIAGKIATNAVTAGTIAAGAVTAGTIAANAVTAVTIAANTIGAKQLIVADFSNMILDAELTDATLWTTGGTYPTMWIFGVVNSQSSGMKSIRTTGTFNTTLNANGNFSHIDLIPVEAGKDYAYGGYIDPSAAVGWADWLLIFFDSANATVGSFTTGAIDVSTTNARLPYSGIATAPATATTVRLYARRRAITGTNEISGTVDFTNWFIRRASSGELIVDGAIIANKIAANAVTTAKIDVGAVTATEIATNAITAVKILAGTITGNKIAAATIYSDLLVASSITARELVLTDYSNVYPDYDHLASTGFYSGSAYTMVGTTNGSYGKNYLRLAVSAAEQSTYSDWISCEQGEYNIEAACQMASSGAGTGQSVIYIQRGTVDGAGVATLVDQFIVCNKTDTSSSTRQNLNFTMDAGQRAMRVRYRRVAGGTSNGIFGGVFIRKRYGANLIVDGAITADHLAVNSIIVGSPALATGAITNAKLATDSVSTAKILTNAVTNDSLAANSVTSVTIANGAVIAGKLAANSVVASNITAGTITADKLVLRTLTGAQIDVGAVLTDNLAVGSVTIVAANSYAASSWAGGNRDISVTVSHGTGSPDVSIFGSGSCFASTTGTPASFVISARAGSTVLSSIQSSMANNTWGGGAIVGVHNPSSGTSSTTYTVRFACSEASSVGVVNISVIVTKR